MIYTIALKQMSNRMVMVPLAIVDDPLVIPCRQDDSMKTTLLDYILNSGIP